ncbi:unnamed protein product [Rotaria socialis]|uniref:Uncharacterized protein n=1 Tax=Rotaria socialis TaxID=392032 RepID=A0A818H7V2_9BILA|nr:unnamed protein product [Rotaria socialis]CAF4931432.1 unnamed protein product [Rotaria socialis]
MSLLDHENQSAYPSELEDRQKKEKSSSDSSNFPNSDITRRGDSTAQYSTDVQCDDLSVNNNPGPGTYKPETAMVIVYKSSPWYTIGARHTHSRPEYTPGPAYRLPDTRIYKYRSAPAYTLGSRHPLCQALFIVPYKE